MSLRALGTLAILAATASAASAQSLDECLAMARNHAPALRAADAGVSRAEHAIRESRAALSPSLRLTADYTRANEAQQTVFPVPGSAAPVVFKIGSATTLDARLIGQYTLYSGGRDAALVHAAEAARLGQQHDRRQAMADLELRVSRAYYRVIAARRLAAAADEARTSALAHRALSVARVRAGVAPRLDSLNARVDVAERTSALVRAAETVRIARVELETAVGATLDSTRALVEPPMPLAGVPDVTEATTRALRDRPEIAAYREALRENQLRYDAARAAKRPTVNLTATAQYLGPNREEDYWDPSDPGLRTHRFFAGVGLQMPLYDAGLVNARASEVASDHQVLDARRQDTELVIRREVEQAVSDLTVAQAEWQSDTSRVTTAREALRVAEAGYKGGTSTGTDVRDAESALADARGDEAQSLMDYWSARASFDHATGAAGRGEH